MANNIQVVEDGVGSSREQRPTQPSWIVGVAGFALGLGLGVLIVGPTPAEPPIETTPGTASPDEGAAEVTTGTEVGDPSDDGVAGVIPGFPDAILVIARTSGTALDHVLWPNQGAVRVRSMTGGDEVRLDVGSQFIAMSDGVPGLDGVLLSMGRFNSIQPVASGVLGYSWHDSESALLAYTQSAGEVTRLSSVKADLTPVPVAEIPSPGGVIAGWGDWGWAIQQRPNEIVLLAPGGEFKDSEPGVAHASHRSGWIFATEGPDAKFVSSGGGVRRVPEPIGVGSVVDAAFSPDGSRVAVAGTRGLAVLDVETQEVTVLSESSTRSVAWSSDSRFVL
ncbi:MAG TPA: hypothetical protein VFZ80_01105, partial [Acidimicrobiia bacterium]